MEVRTLLNAVPQRLIDLRKRKSNQNDQQEDSRPDSCQSMPPQKTLEYHPHAEESISIELSKAPNSDVYPDLQRVDGLVAALQRALRELKTDLLQSLRKTSESFSLSSSTSSLVPLCLVTPISFVLWIPTWPNTLNDAQG